MNYTELINRIEELKGRKGRGSISADETFSLLMELAEKTKAVDINAGSLTIRRVYVSVAAMNADKNPGDQETNKPLKFGQLVCVCNSNDITQSDNGKIYRYNKPGWEFLRQVGDMVQFAKTEKVAQLEAETIDIEQFRLDRNSNITASNLNASDTVELLESKNIFPPAGFPFWRYGSIDNGQDVDDKQDVRITSTMFYKLVPNEKYQFVNFNPNFRISVQYYDSEKNSISWSNYYPITTPTDLPVNLSIPGNAVYVKFLLRKTEESKFAPEDINSVNFIVTLVNKGNTIDYMLKNAWGFSGNGENNLISNNPVDYEQGSLNADGDVPTTVRIRNKGYISFSADSWQMTYKGDYRISVYFYKYEGGTYDYISNSEYVNTGYIGITPEGTTHIRYICMCVRDKTKVMTPFNDVPLLNAYLCDYTTGLAGANTVTISDNVNLSLLTRNIAGKREVVFNNVIDWSSLNWKRGTLESGTPLFTTVRFYSNFIKIPKNSFLFKRSLNEKYRFWLALYDSDKIFIRDISSAGYVGFRTENAEYARLVCVPWPDRQMYAFETQYLSFALMEADFELAYNENLYLSDLFPTDEEYWEQGSILGDHVSSNTSIRLRSKPIYIKTNTAYKVNVPENSIYGYNVHLYKKSGNHLVFVEGNSPYSTTSFEISNGEANLMYIVVIDSTDNGRVLQPNEMTNAGVSIIEMKRMGSNDRPVKLKIGQFNEGLYNYGLAPIGLPNNETYSDKLTQWRNLISSLVADILFCCEHPENSKQGSTEMADKTYDLIYKSFFPYKYGVNGWTYIFSKFPLFDVGTFRTTAGNRQYVEAKIKLHGQTIQLACYHPVAGQSPTYPNAREQRIADNTEIAQKYLNIGRVIIGADTNAGVTEELDPYRNAGYTLANWGYWGAISTYPNHEEPIDNIISLGFEINKFEVIQEQATSDHFPITAEITILL